MALLARYVDPVHARRLIIDTFGRSAHHAAFHQRTVQRQRVETVGTRLFTRHFPVAGQGEALRRAEQFKTIVSPAEQLVHVVFDVAQIFVERRAIDVPGGKDQATIKVNLGLLQAQGLLVHIVAVHLFAFNRRADEVAVRSECPAVVNALVNALVAGFAKAYAHAAVGADIQRNIDFAILAASHDHIVFRHVANDEVAGFWNFAFMAQQQPGFGENLFHFEVVELFVGHHAKRDLIALAHDQIVKRGSVAQY